MKNIKINYILTTHAKHYHPKWANRTELLPGYVEYFARFGSKHSSITFLVDLYFGCKLFFISKRYKAVVTGSERLALVFAGLQLLRRNKIPHILIQSMWNFQIHKGPNRWKKLLWRYIINSVTTVFVYERRQIQIYASTIGIPESKLRFVYSHTSLYDRFYECNDGNYVFTGGDTNRDYETLIEAANKLPYRIEIVTSGACQLSKKFALPQNVVVRGRVSEDEFNQLIAKASVVVIPLKSGMVEMGGRSVYQNAMAFGKPVVVADDGDASDYIRNGVDGLVIKSGDIEALRVAIKSLMENRQLSEKIGENAKKASQSFRPEVFFDEVFSIIDNL